MKNKKHHYFASSALNWTTNESLEKCLQQQRRADTAKGNLYKIETCAVYKVPLPADAHYSIDNYIPKVEGVELIDRVVY